MSSQLPPADWPMFTEQQENCVARSLPRSDAPAVLDPVHEAGWSHDDLQPAHIRCADDTALFIDFGMGGSPGTSHGAA